MKRSWGVWPDTNNWPAVLDTEIATVATPGFWGAFQSMETEPLFYGGQVSAIDAKVGRYCIGWNPGSLTCAQMSTGKADQYVSAAASLVKSYPTHTFFVRLLPEFNGNWNSYAVKGQPSGNSYVEFVAAWRRIVGMFRSAGVTNVEWVWNPNVSINGAWPFDSCYPGDEWVDIVGMDGYNSPSSDVWRTATEIFQSTYDDLRKLAPSKPVWICEAGCEESSSHSKASWITDLLTVQVPKNMSAVENLMWWEKSSGGWRLNTSSASVSSFKSALPAYTGA